MEAECFLPEVENIPHVKIEISGTGGFRTAFSTAEFIHLYDPRAVILAGIAGAYPGSGLSVGEVMLVGSECSADMGSYDGGKFIPKFAERFDCPYVAEYDGGGWTVATSNTVNTAAAPHAVTGAQIENMEGAAFFHACLEYAAINGKEIPFLEVRVVSNIVGQPFDEWDIPPALENLAKALKKIIG